MERGDKKMPRPQIHKATFFCRGYGAAQSVSGAFTLKTGAQPFLFTREC